MKYAFDELEKAGYAVSSATTVVKDKAKTKFVYREALWRGADMFGTGVASFGHVNGVHIQNVDTWEPTSRSWTRANCRSAGRSRPTERDRLIREIVLLLKTGRLDVSYFQREVRRGHPRRVPRRVREARRSEGWLHDQRREHRCTTRDGLMQIDRHLPVFFDPQYISGRYT